MEELSYSPCSTARKVNRPAFSSVRKGVAAKKTLSHDGL